MFTRPWFFRVPKKPGWNRVKLHGRFCDVHIRPVAVNWLNIADKGIMTRCIAIQVQ